MMCFDQQVFINTRLNQYAISGTQTYKNFWGTEKIKSIELFVVQEEIETDFVTKAYFNPSCNPSRWEGGGW